MSVRSRSLVRLGLVVTGFFVVFTLAFCIGLALGLEDEAWWSEILTGQAGLVAGLVLIGALVADLVLPIPSSVVMAASGAVLGPVAGALVNIVGSLLSAWLGYGLCRRFGRAAFRRLVGATEVPGVERWVDHHGAWAIVASRAVPMLTETVSCVAGLAGMPLGRFTGLTLLGVVPVGVVYAVAGAELGARAGLGWALLVALAAPPLLLGAWRLLRRAVPEDAEVELEESG